MSQSTPPPQEHTYTLTRDLDASASQVFDAWTAPAQYEQWAGAAPGTVEIDARPGGTWKAVMVTPDGQRIPLTGSYLAVVPDERLVIGMDVPGRSVPATMTLVFEESAGAGTTRVTL
ncbi:SRPBCC domain-containing protein [Streptomyces sp. NPDC056352]